MCPSVWLKASGLRRASQAMCCARPRHRRHHKMSCRQGAYIHAIPSDQLRDCVWRSNIWTWSHTIYILKRQKMLRSGKRCVLLVVAAPKRPVALWIMFNVVGSLGATFANREILATWITIGCTASRLIIFRNIFGYAVLILAKLINWDEKVHIYCYNFYMSYYNQCYYET